VTPYKHSHKADVIGCFNDRCFCYEVVPKWYNPGSSKIKAKLRLMQIV